MSSRVRRVVYVRGSSRKICQLTGQCDRQFKGDCDGQFAPAFNRTGERAGLAGTDLGASFDVTGGRTYFLFGDTQPAGRNIPGIRPRDGDSIAYTTSASPEPGIDLEFIKADDGKYLSPSVPGVRLTAFEVPTGGFEVGPQKYIFFTTGRTATARMTKAVLAATTDFRTFEKVYDVPVLRPVARAKFINICPWKVTSPIDGLPTPSILLFGSGEYRKSHPYLAYVPRASVRNPSAIRYLAGLDGNRPHWDADQRKAIPLFEHPVIGELSVTYNPYIDRWIMLYNSSDLNLPWIVCRVAEKPWGPWSAGETIFDPCAEQGFCHFIHLARTPALPACSHLAPCPERKLSDPGSEDKNGGPYGPYQISRYAQPSGNGTTIYWVMSTWNPYNVVLMKSKLEIV